MSLDSFKPNMKSKTESHSAESKPTVNCHELLNVLFKCWLCLAVSYYQLTLLLHVISLSLDFSPRKLVVVIVGSAVVTSYTVIFYTLLKRRTRAKKLINELALLVQKTDSDSYFKVVFRLKILVFGLVTYAVILGVLGYFVSLEHGSTKHELMKIACFWCDSTQFPNVALWTVDLFTSIHFVMYPISTVPFGMLMSTWYGFQAILMTKYCKALFEKIGENTRCEELVVLRRRSQRLLDLIERMNRLYQDVMFVWFSATFLISCQVLVGWVSNYSGKNLVLNVFVLLEHGQDVFNLVTLTLVASRLPDMLSESLTRLAVCLDPPIQQVGYQELQFIHTILNRPHGLRVGGCVLITRGLLLSLAGLSATYAIVFLQLSPEALRKFHGQISENCHKSNFTLASVE